MTRRICFQHHVFTWRQHMVLVGIRQQHTSVDLDERFTSTMCRHIFVLQNPTAQSVVPIRTSQKVGFSSSSYCRPRSHLNTCTDHATSCVITVEIMTETQPLAVNRGASKQVLVNNQPQRRKLDYHHHHHHQIPREAICKVESYEVLVTFAYS